MTIYLISDIKAHAEAAARLDSAAFNPYPYHSEAYALFSKYFQIERAQLALEDAIQISAATDITHSLEQFEAAPAPTPRPHALITVSGWAK